MTTTLLRRFHGFLLLLALLGLGAGPARASHLLGGEMSYRYLDANGPTAQPFRYEVTVNLYSNGLFLNDPSIAPPPAQVQVQIFNRTNGAFVTSIVASRQGPLGQPIQPSVPQGCSVVGPSQPFYLLRYVQTVNLPVSFDGYYAVFSLAARNYTLANLNAPASAGQPLTLNVTMAPPLISNRSPVFSDTAVAIVCQNDTTISLNNAVDPDGDRLVYSFGTPYGNLVQGTQPPVPQPVPYFPGFSAANPFGTGPGNFALLNASTGVARYGARVTGLYVVAVDVSEYRTINGREVLIGTTRRDLQLVVSTCPPTPPPVLPPVVTTPRTYTIEEGESLSIPITATQSSPNHPLVLTVNSVLLDGSGPFDATFNGNPGTVQPGNVTGTATATGNNVVSGTFVFNSACGNARATPYDLGVTVRDNGCGGKLASDVFRITVTRAAGPSAINGPATVCDPAVARTYTAAGPVPGSYRWRVVGGTIAGGQGTAAVQVTWAPTATTGTLVLKGISTRGCPTDSVTKTVDIRPLAALTVSPNAPSICPGASATLTVAGQAGLAYTWTGGGLSATGPSVTVTPAATTTYTVTGTDGTCSTAATVTVTVVAPPVANAGPDRTVCPGVASTPLGAAPVAGFTYAWSPATGLSSTTVAQPTVTLTNTTGAPLVVVYTLTVTSGASCTNVGTVRVTVDPGAIANAGPARAVCPGVASVPLGTAALPGYTYSWSPATGLSSSTEAQPTVTLPNVTGAPLTATYTVTATSGPGCVATSAVTVTVNPAAVATPGPALSFCSGTVSAPLGGAAGPVPGATYSWSPATGLSNPNILNPTVTGTNTTGAPVVVTYTLTVTTAAGCAASGTVAVTINPAAVADTGPARQTCPNVPVTIGGTPTPGTTYAWSPATGLSSTSVLNPTVTLPNPGPTNLIQIYTLTATTGNGCIATATVAVTVTPGAVADAGPDAAVCDRSRLTLGTPARAGYTYSWSPATGLSSATAAQPVLTGANPTAAPLTLTYTVTATTGTGCVATDAVTITVNPRPAPAAITGPVSVCPTVTGVAYAVLSPVATAYQWLVTGSTIASGQGTPAITVNWGPATTGAVRVFRFNAQGCSSDTTALPVVINQRLQTVRPTGPGDIVGLPPLPRAICQADGPYTYRSGVFTNGSSFSWVIIGGTQVSTAQNTVAVSWNPVTVPTVGKIVAIETSNPSGGVCRGVSDTLRVLINPSPRTTLALVSPPRVCQGSGPVTVSLPGGFAGSTYVFQLNGVTLAGAGNSRTVAALPAPGTYTLTAQETTAAPASCVGPLYSVPFTVNPLPAAPVISGSGFVCVPGAAQPYAIANPPAGATYQWAVTGGSITAGGIGPQVTVRFDPTGPYAVSATEISADPARCAGPATTRVILFDNPGLVLANASVDAASNARIVLTLTAPNSANTPNPVRILRRVAGTTGAFAPVGTAPAAATTYTDANGVDAAANSYEYQLDLANGCGSVVASTTAQTIRLAATATAGGGGRGAGQGSTALRWNAYVGFPVAEYRVYRRADAGAPELLQTIAATQPLQATVPNAPDPTSATGAGFVQGFRVVAVGTGPAPLLSNSNEATVNFAGPLQAYNVITPNHDGQNDVLVIDNVQLYPGSTFTVFNRWGREVYRTTNYQNNWGGDDNTPPGNYFYLLKLPDGTNLKNWFEVIK